MAFLPLLWRKVFGVKMIFCREYSSIHEIDPEFIPSLEGLLEGTLPDLKFLEMEEKEKTDQEYFVYHLFFGPRTNSPIGFAKAVVHIDKEVKPTFMNRLMKKDGLEKSVEWNISKDTYSGFVFDPRYSDGLKEASIKAIDKLYKGNEVLSQKLYFDGHDQNTFAKENNSIESTVMPDALVKNQGNYPGYLSSLSKEAATDIKSQWKRIYQDPEIKMGEYHNFKEAFAYKERGSEQYKELKNSSLIKKYQDANCEKVFLTLENDYEVLALSIYCKGQNHHHFFEVIMGNENFSIDLLLQTNILKFYEESSGTYLHAVKVENEPLFKSGFNKKQQLSILSRPECHDSRTYH